MASARTPAKVDPLADVHRWVLHLPSTCAAQVKLKQRPHPFTFLPSSHHCSACPLYPRKRTCAAHKPMSALCQKRTSRPLGACRSRLPELIDRQRNHQQSNHDKIYPSHRNTNTHRPRAYYQPDSEYDADPFLPCAKSRQRYDLGHDNQKSGNHRGLCRCGVKTEWQNPR